MRLGILVVDDHRDCRESLARLLQAMGHEVWTADCGEAACDLAARHLPQLMLLDIGMPDMDGYEVVRQLRQNSLTRRMTVIALSGWTREIDRRRCLAAGFDCHLAKPVELATLEGVLESVSAE